MHLCEQNNGPVSVSLRADSPGFMAAANGANVIAQLSFSAFTSRHVSLVVDDRPTICLSIDLGIKLYLQCSVVGAIGERILELARVARCLR
jgi:hypothetical protein